MNQEFYDRAMARIVRLALGFGLIGTIVAVAKFGLRGGSGFGAGVLLSLFSFHTFREVAESLGSAANRRRTTFAILFALRYGLIGGAVYVIVRYLEVSLMAILAGLFVSAAAVIAEILYELGFSKKIDG
jgi:hypothetical protein